MKRRVWITCAALLWGCLVTTALPAADLTQALADAKAGKLESAAPLLEDAISAGGGLNDTKKKAVAALADAYAKTGKFHRLAGVYVQHAKDAATGGPEYHAQILMQTGKCYEAMTQPGYAIQKYIEIYEKVAPKSDLAREARYRTADLRFYQLGAMQDAVPEYRVLARTYPKDPRNDMNLRKAIAFYIYHKPDGVNAVQVVSEWSQVIPKNAPMLRSFFTQAFSYRDEWRPSRLGDWKYRAALLELFLQLYPADPERWDRQVELAQAYVSGAGTPEKAAALIAEALLKKTTASGLKTLLLVGDRHEPSRSAVLTSAMNALPNIEKVERKPLLTEVFSRMLRKDWENKAGRQARLRQALVLLDGYQKAYGDDGWGLSNQGAVRMELGETDAAIAALKKGLDVEPSYRAGQQIFDLAKAYATKGGKSVQDGVADLSARMNAWQKNLDFQMRVRLALADLLRGAGREGEGDPYLLWLLEQDPYWGAQAASRLIGSARQKDILSILKPMEAFFGRYSFHRDAKSQFGAYVAELGRSKDKAAQKEGRRLQVVLQKPPAVPNSRAKEYDEMMALARNANKKSVTLLEAYLKKYGAQHDTGWGSVYTGFVEPFHDRIRRDAEAVLSANKAFRSPELMAEMIYRYAYRWPDYASGLKAVEEYAGFLADPKMSARVNLQVFVDYGVRCAQPLRKNAEYAKLLETKVVPWAQPQGAEVNDAVWGTIADMYVQANDLKPIAGILDKFNDKTGEISQRVLISALGRVSTKDGQDLVARAKDIAAKNSSQLWAASLAAHVATSYGHRMGNWKEASTYAQTWLGLSAKLGRGATTAHWAEVNRQAVWYLGDRQAGLAKACRTTVDMYAKGQLYWNGWRVPNVANSARQLAKSLLGKESGVAALAAGPDALAVARTMVDTFPQGDVRMYAGLYVLQTDTSVDPLSRALGNQTVCFCGLHNKKEEWSVVKEYADSLHSQKKIADAYWLYVALADSTAFKIKDDDVLRKIDLGKAELGVGEALQERGLTAMNALMAQGEEGRAIEAYEKNRAELDKEFDRLSGSAIAAIAKYHINKKEFEKADTVLRRFLRNTKNSATDRARAQFLLGEEYMVAQKYETAILEFGTAVSEYPREDVAKDAKLRIGQCYVEMKMFDKAISFFKKLEEDESDQMRLAEIDYNFGLLFFKKGDLDMAEQYLQRCMQTNVGHQWAKLLMAQIYQSQGRPYEALQVTKGIGDPDKTAKVTPGKTLDFIIIDEGWTHSLGKDFIPVRIWSELPDGKVYDQMIVRLDKDRNNDKKFYRQVSTQLGKPNPNDRVLQLLGTCTIKYTFAKTSN